MGEREFLKMNRVIQRLFGLTLIAVLVVVFTIGLSGCGNKEPEPSAVEKPLKLYYISKEYMESGDVSNGALIEYNGLTISLPAELPDGMSKEEANTYGYTAALTNLWEVPEGLDNAETAVSETFGIRNIWCKDGLATVDMEGSTLHGGSMEETAFISQIVETLINSFDEIHEVQFWVDGEPAETLMGHCDTGKPFKDSLLKEQRE